jgi:hypothetical protein
MEQKKINSESPPMAHSFFFQLVDNSEKLKARFIALCVKYLSGHPGQVYFSVGTRVLQIDRDVSGTNFEISVNIIFKDFAAYTAYSKSSKHEKFIFEAAGMSPTRVVYDSFLEQGDALGNLLNHSV